MQTKILDALGDKSNSIASALDWLMSGMPVVFPTETVYGLGSGIFDINAVEKVFTIKGRDRLNPLSAHISSVNDALMLCTDIKDEYYKLAEEFLPGPLSIVMKKRKEVSDLVTGGSDTISIRLPDNDIFRLLSEKFGQPIAATSANKSGKPSPVTALHAFEDLQGLVPVILDSGRCRYQIESTVISLAGDEPVLIRPGAISQKRISEVLGREIKSLSRQITIFNHQKSSLDNSKFKIICFDEFSEILDFCNSHRNNKIIVMSRSNYDKNIENIIRTDESTFFNDLREAEKSRVEFLLVEKDDYVMTSEVLRHRLKIS